ncbi:MAG TPA: DUF4919 domain-containing protein [Myxococcaceae bacterium]|nr:DUF4919 domain-containing protein [Myxococcaceae bacterium]
MAGAVGEAEARYADLVRRAEAGEAIDFRALRWAWLHGASMKIDPWSERLSALRDAMFEAMGEQGDPAVVLARAREILEINYVDLDAQMARWRACELLKDEPCIQRSRVISQGLLDSVIEGGNGASCATAWKVVSVDEEYFVLRVMGARRLRQAVVKEGGNTCDALEVEREDGRRRTLYFEISEVLAAVGRRLGAGSGDE